MAIKKILEIFDNDVNNPHLWPGGIRKHVISLTNLFQNDTDIRLVPHFWKTAKTVKFFNKMKVSKKELKQTISEYDSIHVHGFMSILVIQAFKEAIKQKKTILWAPHYHPFYTLNRPILGKIWFHILIKPFLKKLQVIIVANRESYDFFSHYVDTVTIIPHWNDCRQRFNLKKNSKQILFVGRNEPNKGLEYLYSLPKDEYNVHLVTSGDIQRPDFIKHENISDDDLQKLYAESSLLVVPSRYESWSLVTIESLLQNTPVVLSDRVRVKDVIPDCDYVRVFNFGDFSGFHNAVKETIGKNVDVNKMTTLFSSEKIKEIYKSYFIGAETR